MTTSWLIIVAIISIGGITKFESICVQEDDFATLIFDFDHAIKLPSGVDRTQYRFPYHKSWGTINVITDTRQGEYDFNPFVFNVSVLGVSFCHSYQYLAPLVPMFAPFFDRLIIRNLARFIASETLSFFEDIISQLSEEELDRQIELGDYAQPTPYNVFDWWAYVTPEFLNKWVYYREPLAIPWTTTLLRKVCQTPWGCHTVPRTRRFMSQMFSLLRHKQPRKQRKLNI